MGGAGVRAGVGAGRFQGEPGLADAAGSRQRHQAGVGEGAADPGQFRFAAHEAGELGRETRAGRGLRPVPEQVEVERGQVGRRVGAQLVREAAPRLLEHREGLGGPPGRVQGPHQLPVQPFVQRTRPEQRPQLGHQFRPAPETQLRLDPVLYDGQPQLLQPGPVGVRVRQGGQRRPAPQREGVAQEGRRPRMIAGGERRTAFGGQARETVDVDRVRVDGEGVAGGDGVDAGVRRETPAQAGDLGLERARGPGGRLGAVQTVQQALHGHRAAGVEQQQREQGAGPGAAGVEGSAVVGADLDRAQDAEAHSVDSGRRRPFVRTAAAYGSGVRQKAGPPGGGPAQCSEPGSGRARMGVPPLERSREWGM